MMKAVRLSSTISVDQVSPTQYRLPTVADQRSTALESKIPQEPRW